VVDNGCAEEVDHWNSSLEVADVMCVDWLQWQYVQVEQSYCHSKLVQCS